MMENISNILKRYPGEENIFLYAEDTKKLYKYNGFSVTISDRLITELNNILPKENIKIKKLPRSFWHGTILVRQNRRGVFLS